MFGIARTWTQGQRDRKAVEAVYEILTVQALSPWFYDEIGVDCSFTGRFDVAVLHAHFVFERLQSDASIPKRFSQRLFDCFMGNWDFALRESGVGDMSMSKHIKRVTQGFFGRAQAYADALAHQHTEARRQALAEALTRNLNLGHLQDLQMGQLISYVVGLQHIFAACSSAELRAGQITLGKPDEIAQIGAKILGEP
jgi:cytochrome b pre-mRNA-processing protein 3